MKERWDERCQQLLVQAKQEAIRLEHHFLGTEHIILAMLAEGDGLLCSTLRSLQVDPGAVVESIISEVTPTSVLPHEGFPLSPRIRQIVVEAERLCTLDGLPTIGEAHLLTALLRAGRGVAVRAIESQGVSAADLSDRVRKPRSARLELDCSATFYDGLPPGGAARAPGLLPQTDEDGDAEAEARSEAVTLPGRVQAGAGRPAPDVDAEERHEGLTLPVGRREAGPPAGPSTALPRGGPGMGTAPGGGATLAQLPRSSGPIPVVALQGNPVLIDLGVIKTPQTPPRTPTLDRVGRDLTALAREGNLGPIWGRDAEIEMLTRTLCRASRNNPLLVGESGVGKTAVVEALAIDVVREAVPAGLRDVRIVEVPVTALTADPRRGEGEDRATRLLEEARDNNTILVVDDIHAMAGGGQVENATDAAAVLRPFLSRGELRIIGVTQPRHVAALERDPGLVRCFHFLTIDEPSDEVVREILRDVSKRLEIFHHVRVEEAAVEAAISMVRRYVKDRCMPDAAIDVLDEACTRGAEISPPPNFAQADADRRRASIDANRVAAVISQRTGIPVANLTTKEIAPAEEADHEEAAPAQEEGSATDESAVTDPTPAEVANRADEVPPAQGAAPAGGGAPGAPMEESGP